MFMAKISYLRARIRLIHQEQVDFEDLRISEETSTRDEGYFHMEPAS